MDAAAPTHRPDEHTTADVIKFCSASCMFDFQCMPMCPDCGRDSKDGHVKKPGEGWLNPYMMRKVGAHTQAIMRIQMDMYAGQMAMQEATGTEKNSLLSEQEKLRQELVTHTAAFKDAEKNCELPNMWCRRCDVKCYPRDPSVLLRNKDVCKPT